MACLAVLLAVVTLTIYFDGAPLGPPADPSNEFPARPEWYFLFLFQLLKYVPAFWGAVIIPVFLVTWMFLQPFIAKKQWGHKFNVGFWWTLIAGSVMLTFLAISEDRANPKHAAALKEADWQAERVIDIANKEGIPPTGAVSLLRKDPENLGRRLFSTHCSSCHRYNGHDGRGFPVSEKQSAADLAGFGSVEWNTRLLDHDQYVSEKYFGGTKFKDGTMAKKALAKYDEEEKSCCRKSPNFWQTRQNFPTKPHWKKKSARNCSPSFTMTTGYSKTAEPALIVMTLIPKTKARPPILRATVPETG